MLPPGWEEAMVYGINNHGEVIGNAEKSGTAEKDPERAGFIYKDEMYTELQPQGFSCNTVVAINEKGTVLGYGANDFWDTPEWFVYKADKYVMTLRPPLSPRTAHFDTVSDINDYGTIVGSCSTGSWWSPGIIFGFINRASIYTKLSPKGYEHTEAIAINNHGQVIGWVAEEYNITGFIYRCGMYKWLNVPGTTYTKPWDINDHGEVVGLYGDFNAGFTKGFVYSNGTYTELLPPGWISSVASSINNNGVVVGCGTDGNQIQKMFIAEPQDD